MATFDLSRKDIVKVYNADKKEFVTLEEATESRDSSDKFFSGYHSHSSGAKREKMGNPRYDYLPARLVNDYYGKIAEFGAQKYAPRNWEKGLPQSQIASSIQRHLWAYMEGEEMDQESGLPHVAHMLWNAVALLYNYHNNLEDDRIPVETRK